MLPVPLSQAVIVSARVGTLLAQDCQQIHAFLKGTDCAPMPMHHGCEVLDTPVLTMPT